MISGRLQAVAIVLSSGLLVIVFELVRRRRLVERYALLWLGSAAVLLVLSVWSELLEKLSDAVGIEVPANALFAVAIGFIMVLLLHFSVAISRLSEENKILAQESARLDRELREERAGRDPSESNPRTSAQ